jgi:hypothetical protein
VLGRIELAALPAVADGVISPPAALTSPTVVTPTGSPGMGRISSSGVGRLYPVPPSTPQAANRPQCFKHIPAKSEPTNTGVNRYSQDYLGGEKLHGC